MVKILLDKTNNVNVVTAERLPLGRGMGENKSATFTVLVFILFTTEFVLWILLDSHKLSYFNSQWEFSQAPN